MSSNNNMSNNFITTPQSFASDYFFWLHSPMTMSQST